MYPHLLTTIKTGLWKNNESSDKIRNRACFFYNCIIQLVAAIGDYVF